MEAGKMTNDWSTPAQEITVHQYHFHAGPGDAITQQMFFIQKALASQGIRGEIFASKFTRKLLPRVKAFHQGALWNGDLLLIHHSFGNPAFPRLLRVEIPKAIVYHNITPEEFFAHDPYLAALSRRGRSQLRRFRKYVTASFADSRYNAAELVDLGFPDPQPLPLFDLTDYNPDRPLVVKKKNGPLRLLFVGRIAPHKNQALLIRLFYHLRERLPKDSELVIVGGGDRIYLDYLKLLRRQLGLVSQVNFAGHVKDEELRAFYSSADAFLCLSRHEGFCIPLVEAMKQDIPVFAAPWTGVADTMAGSGVHLLHPESISETAQAIASVLSSSKAREAVLLSQRQRLLDFQKEQNASQVVERITKLVREIRHSPQTTMRSLVPAAW
jgi:glycosyltransferase involved in cell wall biosynthesis